MSGEAPDLREQGDCPSPEACGGTCDQHTVKIEPRCPGPPECTAHEGSDVADFDHYCDAAGVAPGEEGPAFAAWMNALTGWDGDAGPIEG